nr:PAS domain S-box protein [Desulfobacterales bacterium]
MAKKPTYEELEQRVRELEKEAFERKGIEEELKESEEKSRVITESSWTGIIILRQDRIEYANPRFSKMVGYAPGEIIGQEFLMFVHPDDRRMVYMQNRRRLRGEYAPPLFDVRLLKRNGEIIWVNCIHSLGKFQNQDAVIVNLVDVTDRKRAEEQIRIAHSELNQIFNTAADGMRVIDTEFNILRVNNTFCYLAGVSKDEAVGKKCYEVFYGSLCHTPDCPLTRILGGEDRIVCEVEKERNDGHKIPCILTAIAFRGAKGELLGIIEDFRDISERVRAEEALRREHQELEKRVAERTADLMSINQKLSSEIAERKRVEEALRESEEKYRIITENSLSGIIIIQEGIIKYANPRFGEMVGYEPDEIIGQEALRFVHPDDRKLVDQYAQQRLRGEDVPTFLELRLLNKKEEITWADCIYSLARFQNRTALIVNVVDITERKLAANKLLTYQEQLRSLASELSLTEERERREIAVALHDRIGQTLAISKIKLEVLRESLSSTGLASAIEEICELIEQTIQDTRSLTLELSPHILYELGFVPAVEWLTEQIQQQNDIMIHLEDDGKPKPLADDIGFLLFRAVRELLINVTKHAQARCVNVSLVRDGNELRINVEDDGTGFKACEIGSQMNRTGGFGLFSIRERLSHFDGHLEVASEPGQGTKVTLVIPLMSNNKAPKENMT